MRKMTAGLFFTENMSKEGANQAMMFTADTDVAVIATSVFSELILLELWIEFGKTANRKYIPIFEIVKSLGPERAWCLTFFHSLTGYYKVLFSSSCGNREAWKTWQNYLWLTESLVKLCNNPTAKVIESKMNTFEKIFCLMYHAASTKYEVNKCRRQSFA